MTEIRNINDGTFDPNNPNHVYVGRAAKFKGKWLKASPFANPFKVKKHTSEEHIQAVRKYYDYLEKNPELQNRIRKELRGKTLYCWCKPLPCHGDLLVLVADSIDSEACCDIFNGNAADTVELTCDCCGDPIKEGGQPLHENIGVGWRTKSGGLHNETFSLDFTLCSNECSSATQIFIHSMFYQMGGSELCNHLVQHHGFSEQELIRGLEKMDKVNDLIEKNDLTAPRMYTKVMNAGRKVFMSH